MTRERRIVYTIFYFIFYFFYCKRMDRAQNRKGIYVSDKTHTPTSLFSLCSLCCVCSFFVVVSCRALLHCVCTVSTGTHSLMSRCNCLLVGYIIFLFIKQQQHRFKWPEKSFLFIIGIGTVQQFSQKFHFLFFSFFSFLISFVVRKITIGWVLGKVSQNGR